MRKGLESRFQQEKAVIDAYKDLGVRKLANLLYGGKEDSGGQKLTGSVLARERHYSSFKLISNPFVLRTVTEECLSMSQVNLDSQT